MARVTISLDDGTTVEITQVSPGNIFGGVEAGQMAQVALVKAISALGLHVQPATESDEKGPEDGPGGRGASAGAGRERADVPGGPERDEGRKR